MTPVLGSACYAAAVAVVLKDSVPGGGGIDPLFWLAVGIVWVGTCEVLANPFLFAPSAYLFDKVAVFIHLLKLW